MQNIKERYYNKQNLDLNEWDHLLKVTCNTCFWDSVKGDMYINIRKYNKTMKKKEKKKTIYKASVQSKETKKS